MVKKEIKLIRPEINSNEISIETEELNLVNLLFIQKTRVLKEIDEKRSLIKGQMKILSSKKLRKRLKIREIQKSLTMLEDNWFVQLIAAEMLLNARKKIMRSQKSLHFMSEKTVIHSFSMPKTRELEGLISSQTHLLSSTHERVNMIIKSSRLKLIRMDFDGVIRYQCI